ncbi:uncharacterized protein BX663DRAFT_438814, partial [Cokeromyces recurvatus]|uniref:uncharacterized protein n=1 Tax=Cokeromyces recurvatus TaxID=90255 RepID=UPI00221F9169
IIVRITQHYVKLYKDDEEKHLSGTIINISICITFRSIHTSFLIIIKKNVAVALWEARIALLSVCPNLISITSSSLHNHLGYYISLTLKKLNKFVAARTSEKNLQTRSGSNIGMEIR